MDSRRDAPDGRITVLMVDDEPFLMRAVQRVLSSAGLDVELCGDWTSITRLVRELNPALVLMDYDMPMLSGDDICMILRRSGIGQDTKIVFYSSGDETFLREATLRCHADGYISKRMRNDQLVRAVSRYVA